MKITHRRGKRSKKREVQYFILKLEYPASSQRVDRADPFLALFFFRPSRPTESTKWSTQ
uniref:Uncharacterized protein n=1 Tax=Anguilla anguilla TaxID=7936 RepID=A0A0E9THZ9_ANGAN